MSQMRVIRFKCVKVFQANTAYDRKHREHRSVDFDAAIRATVPPNACVAKVLSTRFDTSKNGTAKGTNIRGHECPKCEEPVLATKVRIHTM